ncbi:MAG: SDR family oxidoreductase [Candidatus Alcyoniella australis]|nr:SDR family oxidoreductase [Candidatus Alcyoniella australis]
MGLLDGKVAVITGSGSGIGREYALLFAKEGAKVVINDLGGSRDGSGDGSVRVADEVVAEIQAAGGEAAANYDSVATMEGGLNIVKTAVDAFGKLDILVNNAGILRDKTLTKMPEDWWDLVIAVHLKGTFSCSQAAANQIREQGSGGRIITTSSLAGLIGNFGQTNYGSAKAGIAGFTRVAAVELMKSGITVNCIAPVAVTRLTEDLPMFQAEGVAQELSPAHIAPLALFLASDLSANITGKIFGIQGGKVFLYQMVTSEGVVKDGVWSAQDIADNLDQIMKI